MSTKESRSILTDQRPGLFGRTPDVWAQLSGRRPCRGGAVLLTILRWRGNPPSIAFIHRVYRDLAYIAVVVVAILVLEAIFRIALQNYWFGELGQQYRYWFALGLADK